MKTSDFYYDLPKELIAQDPLEDRSSSRLRASQERTQELLQIIEMLELRQTTQPEERDGDCIISLLSQ